MAWRPAKASSSPTTRPRRKPRSPRCTGRLVIEEFLTGEEVSFIALCDGRDAFPLAATQDHKAVFDGDTGPEHRRHGRVLRRPDPERGPDPQSSDRVIHPTVERTNFTGFLYAG